MHTTFLRAVLWTQSSIPSAAQTPTNFNSSSDVLPRNADHTLWEVLVWTALVHLEESKATPAPHPGSVAVLPALGARKEKAMESLLKSEYEIVVINENEAYCSTDFFFF